MTHIETPWQQARENLLLDEPSHALIKKDWIKEYYAARVQIQEEEKHPEVSAVYPVGCC